MRTCVTASTHQACVCVMVLGVCVSVSANTLSVRVCVCVNYGCVCERQHAHITIERLLWQLLPRRLQCYLVYGRRHLNTCPIFPQSPSHGIGPRISTGTTAAKWHLGRLFLQLLPLVSNKHLISLSLIFEHFSPMYLHPCVSERLRSCLVCTGDPFRPPRPRLVESPSPKRPEMTRVHPGSSFFWM
jgi:hypothetical protein